MLSMIFFTFSHSILQVNSFIVNSFAVVVCIVLYLMHKPKVFTDFLMIDVMELLFLIELICTIFIDLKGKK